MQESCAQTRLRESQAARRPDRPHHTSHSQNVHPPTPHICMLSRSPTPHDHYNYNITPLVATDTPIPPSQQTQSLLRHGERASQWRLAFIMQQSPWRRRHHHHATIILTSYCSHLHLCRNHCKNQLDILSLSSPMQQSPNRCRIGIIVTNIDVVSSSSSCNNRVIVDVAIIIMQHSTRCIILQQSPNRCRIGIVIATIKSSSYRHLHHATITSSIVVVSSSSSCNNHHHATNSKHYNHLISTSSIIQQQQHLG